MSKAFITELAFREDIRRKNCLLSGIALRQKKEDKLPELGGGGGLAKLGNA